MDNEQPAANPVVDAPIDAPITHDDIIDLDAPQEAGTPAAEPEVDPLDELAKEALGSVDDANADPELVEIEYEGKTLKVPVEAKDALLRQADYTRKTMDLAEQRRTFEAERGSFTQLATQSVEEFQAHVSLAQLNAQVQQLEQVNIQGMAPEQVNALRLDLQDLTRQRDGLAHNLQTRLSQKAQRESEQLANSRQECLSQVAKDIPNFSDARLAELEKFAIETGVSPEDVASTTEPAAYKLLHYADIGKKFIERQRSAAQMKAAQAGNPATKLGGASASAKSPDDMSMDEYAAWRAAGNG